jgi:hypothetical protein
VNGHPGTNPFSGSALTHGFEIAFYALAAVAALGAALAAVMLEPRSAQPEPEPERRLVAVLEGRLPERDQRAFPQGSLRHAQSRFERREHLQVAIRPDPSITIT